MPICPKCNKVGTQHIRKDSKNSSKLYLEYIHKTAAGVSRCEIGRIRTTDEAIGEFNKPETIEEYQKALGEMATDIQNLLDKSKTYSEKSRLQHKIILAKLKEILDRYGYSAGRKMSADQKSTLTFSKLETIEQYQKALDGMASDLYRLIELCKGYSIKSRIPPMLIRDELTNTLSRYSLILQN